MIQIHDLWWPDDVQSKWVHAFKHVRSIEFAISRCKQFRTAVQAGGNVGLWPRRLAGSFKRVITFEPDAVTRACLEKNVQPNVEVRPEALGQAGGYCGLERESLGSHRIVPGTALDMVPIDSLHLTDCDFLQLDVEGYEYHAMLGAYHTLMNCRPIVQVELRGFTGRYGRSDNEVRGLLIACGYREISKQPGEDYVFENTWAH